MRGAIYCSDCEGPISKNDNAFELCQEFIPDGGDFFTKLSKYDDFLADVVKKDGYKAGDTLKLILPFLKAYGVTDKGIREFSSRNILLIPGAARTLDLIQEGVMATHIVSTSYRPYIDALCKTIGFPVPNTYCTELVLDKYWQSMEEVEKLKELREEIVLMPLLDWPDGASSQGDLPPETQKTVSRLNQIFWQEILTMASGKMLKEVNPIGGYEKARAIETIAERERVSLSEIMYVGDSITDTEAFKLVRENGGLAVSFNGNAYAIREAEIAILSSHALIVYPLADWFERYGKKDVIELVRRWGDPSPQEQLRVVFITDENRELLAKESTAFRKTVRGEAVGKLG